MQQHGEDAPIEAAQRADAMLEAGDMDGYAVWQRIVRAVEELLSKEQPAGATVQQKLFSSYLNSTNTATMWKTFNKAPAAAYRTNCWRVAAKRREMAQRLMVREGQRYAQTPDLLGTPVVWEVVSVYETTFRVPHALLVNVRDRDERKTISCRVLTDDKFYRLVAETAPRALPVRRPFWRRRRSVEAKH